MRLVYDVARTRWGWVAALASSEGLLRLSLPQPSPQRAMEELGPHAAGAWEEPGAFADLFRRIEAYWGGEAVAFDDPLDPRLGTPFQRLVWSVVRGIPYGETRSYQWIAERVGRPRGPRAVGQAVGANKVFLVVPCHRVIGANGELCGYGAGGIEVKRRLLELERGRR